MTDQPRPNADQILEQILFRVRDLRDHHVGPRWIVAVSGGADSVALLRALVAISDQVELSLCVAHLNHGVRGEAAAADTHFVEQLADSLGLPFELGHWTPSRASHFEADARQARYGWLTEVAVRRGAHAIATAHHRDDQAETILHRILRGTGPDGLAGMPLHRSTSGGVTLVRPVLGIARSQLRSFLEAIGQPFRTDATNLDADHTRNRIRLDLLPKLASEYNPQIVDALISLGEAAQRESAIALPQLLDLERLTTLSSDAQAIRFDARMLRRLSLSSRLKVVRRAWRSLELPQRAMTASHWLRMARFTDRTEGQITLPGGVLLTVDEATMIIASPASHPPVDDLDPIPLVIPGRIPLPRGAGWLLASDELTETYDEWIDFERIAPPLVVDRPRPGDRLAPLGMDGRTMPLADFLRGRGLNQAARAQVLVVRDTSGIVWVLGHRISDRVKRTQMTQRCLGLRWERS